MVAALQLKHAAQDPLEEGIGLKSGHHDGPPVALGDPHVLLLAHHGAHVSCRQDSVDAAVGIG